MQVTAEDTVVSPSGQRRGRVCRREDGRFQVVTERLCDVAEAYRACWLNDYPPSGLFACRDDARAHLMALLPDATELHDVEPCTFQLEVGPYPEPVQRTAACKP
jgi:hypothetical protein